MKEQCMIVRLKMEVSSVLTFMRKWKDKAELKASPQGMGVRLFDSCSILVQYFFDCCSLNCNEEQPDTYRIYFVKISFPVFRCVGADQQFQETEWRSTVDGGLSTILIEIKKFLLIFASLINNAHASQPLLFFTDTIYIFSQSIYPINANKKTKF